MKQTVRIIETSLRDGQQSLWATRMTTAMMLPVLPLLDALGFEAVEYTSAAAMEVCIRLPQGKSMGAHAAGSAAS
ncbi:MAG: hypothetical protein U1E61_24195 [Bradyrhizobium sp.]